jgi:hypothetical protein
MKNLFEPATAQEIKDRISQLRPDSARLWGAMTAPQAVAHCAGGLEVALGDRNPPRMLIGRIIGGLIKPKALGDEKPLRRNSPTVPGLVVKDERNLETERHRLCELVDRFTAAGPAGCTQNPHSFFGRLTPEEWSILSYKHLDHHLRQFGV